MSDKFELNKGLSGEQAKYGERIPADAEGLEPVYPNAVPADVAAEQKPVERVSEAVEDADSALMPPKPEYVAPEIIKDAPEKPASVVSDAEIPGEEPYLLTPGYQYPVDEAHTGSLSGEKGGIAESGKQELHPLASGSYYANPEETRSVTESPEQSVAERLGVEQSGAEQQDSSEEYPYLSGGAGADKAAGVDSASNEASDAEVNDEENDGLPTLQELFEMGYFGPGRSLSDDDDDDEIDTDDADADKKAVDSASDARETASVASVSAPVAAPASSGNAPYGGQWSPYGNQPASVQSQPGQSAPNYANQSQGAPTQSVPSYGQPQRPMPDPQAQNPQAQRASMRDPQAQGAQMNEPVYGTAPMGDPVYGTAPQPQPQVSGQASPQRRYSPPTGSQSSAPSGAQYSTQHSTQHGAQNNRYGSQYAPQRAPYNAYQPTPTPVPVQQQRRSIALPLIIGIVIGAIIGGIIGGGVAALISGGITNKAGVPGLPGQTIKIDGEQKTAVTAIAAARTQSVVTFDVANDNKQGSGSGVVLTADGYIVTNAHVVTLDGSAAASFIRVRLSDGRMLPAKLVGMDPYADLAVVKVDDKSLTPIAFANSDNVKVGDLTVAIGAPFDLPSTVTSGIVSALNRGISVKSAAVPERQDAQQQDSKQKPWQFDLGPEKQRSNAAGRIMLPVIQTDASINPGNSGGALLNANGELIGINVAIASAGGSEGKGGSVGLGFSIPSNFVKRITDSLIKGQKPSHGLLGAAVGDASNDGRAQHAGGLISEIVPGSAAAKAGLRKGDVITKVAGVDAADGTAVAALIRMHAGGSKIKVTYFRDGREATAEVQLGELQ